MQLDVIASNAMRQGNEDDESIATMNAKLYCCTRESFPRPIPCDSGCIQFSLRWRMGISLLVLLLALPAVVQAQFSFTTNNGTITITGYSGPQWVVTIPGTINGYPVTNIGASAFYSASLTGVTIPDSVTNIGEGAFYGCYYLTTVTIGTNVTSIGVDAFVACYSLTNINVVAANQTYSSSSGVLFDKEQATLLQFPDGLGGSYTIPSSVTSIGVDAFAFTGLTSVTIPTSLINFGTGFEYCSSLTNITVAASNTVYSSLSGVLFDKAQMTLLQFPEGLGGSYTISNSVTSIGDDAFFRCSYLTNVIIEDSVTSIGGGAFSLCNGLTSVSIGDNVTNIGDEAFYRCNGLTSVMIGNGVTSIGSEVFDDCPSLTNITVAASNTAYSSLSGVLFDKAQMTLLQFPEGLGGSYTIPNSVTNIGEFAFADCSSLSSVTIGSSVSSIGFFAFYHSSSLTGVYFEGNAPTVTDDFSVFSGDNNGTVYYLPATTGWGSTFDLWPTAPWFLPNPLILNASLGFGVQTNMFGFIISWATNSSVVVEASTNLANPDWSPVSTSTLTGGFSYFSDPQWTNYPTRFYRIRSP
jgi:hypothetical protein